MELGFAARTVLAFAVIGAMLLAIQMLARLGLQRRLTRPSGRGRLITIVETTFLPGAASLHVVRIGEEYAVVGRSAGVIAKIADVPPDTIGSWLASRTEVRPRLIGRRRARGA